MYCSNCGEKVDEKAVICIHCGCALHPEFFQNKEKHGKGIASMILGIISTFLAICIFSDFEELAMEASMSESVFGYAFGLILIQLILAIVGICLACSERKTKKNGFNTAGLWLALVTFAIIAIQFICTITY